jgi:hypothetical protein
MRCVLDQFGQNNRSIIFFDHSSHWIFGTPTIRNRRFVVRTLGHQTTLMMRTLPVLLGLCLALLGITFTARQENVFADVYTQSGQQRSHPRLITSARKLLQGDHAHYSFGALGLVTLSCQILTTNVAWHLLAAYAIHYAAIMA